MKWFRMYSEFAFDPKIQSMDETSQRRFVIILCLQCDGCLSQLSDEEVAVALRISTDELQKTKEMFVKKGFIDQEWNVLNWDKRQYISDTSTDRTRRWRAKQKRTSQERHKNVDVTPPDTDTDTETDTDTDTDSNIKKSQNRNKDKNIKKVSRVSAKTPTPDFFPITDQMREYAKRIGNYANLDDQTESFLLYHRKIGSLFADWYAAWQTWIRKDLEINPDHKTPPPKPKPFHIIPGFDPADLDPATRYQDG